MIRHLYALLVAFFTLQFGNLVFAGELTNAHRLARGLPLAKPVIRNPTRIAARQAQQSGGSVPGNGVITVTPTGNRVKRAQAYLVYGPDCNCIRSTEDLNQATIFKLPTGSFSAKELQIYTPAGLSYFGTGLTGQNTFSETVLIVKGISTPDAGTPRDKSEQTSIWTGAGIPGSLTAIYASSDKTDKQLSFFFDNSGSLTATTATRSGQVSLGLMSTTASPTANTPVQPTQSPAATDPTVDQGLAGFDQYLNQNAGSDDAAYLAYLDCIFGSGINCGPAPAGSQG